MEHVERGLSEVTLVPASVLCLMMAAVTAFAGIYHLISFAMRRQEHLHLPFAGLCLSVSAYDIFATGLYEASSVTEGVDWQAHELRAGCLISIFTIWFVFVFTEQRRGPLFRAQLAWFGALFALSWLPWRGFAMSAAEPAIKHVRIPGLIDASSAAFAPIEALAGIQAAAPELARALAAELDRFRGTVQQRDDVTLIAVTLAA